MRRSVELNRRAFVVLASSLIPAAKLFGPRKLIFLSSESSVNHPNAIYVCPPCGLDCDKLEFEQPGNCPVCAMKLIEKGSAPSGAPSVATGTMRFPDGKTFVELPFELLANSVFLELQVNGKGPLLFGLDTGSFNSIVATEIIGTLGIKTEGTGRGLGSGTSFTMSGIRDLNFLLPGGLKLTTTQAAAVSMGPLSNLIARSFDGDLGYDVLKQLVVKIDYEKQSLTFYDPNHFEYSGAGKTVPFTLWAEYDPQIEGEISIAGQPPVPVKIVLDTGAGGTILTTSFVKTHRLTEIMKTLAVPDVGAGGGASTKWEGRAVSLRIGPYTIDKPLVALSTDTIGSLAHASFDVNLGGNILRRFTIIVDYPGKRLILEPNAHFNDPFSSDASGLVLKAEGMDYRTFVVQAVVPNSPASEAGIQPGDVITAIKGHEISKLALWQLQDMLKDPEETYQVKLKRREKYLSSKLRLRALL